MKNKKKLIAAVLGLILLIAAMLCVYFIAGPKTAQGAKELTIQVVDDQEETTSYTVHTDAEYLRQAMEEIDGLTFSGTESEYGLMVDTVNGLRADYTLDGAYWAFYVNDAYCNNGIDTQPVNDKESYSIVYTKADAE